MIEKFSNIYERAIASFHSISFPSEWGAIAIASLPEKQSIYLFPFNYSGFWTGEGHLNSGSH